MQSNNNNITSYTENLYDINQIKVKGMIQNKEKISNCLLLREFNADTKINNKFDKLLINI
jgi:hypothetical protein